MTIPFTPRSAIPIIGQAFVLKGGFPTVLGQCGCEAKEPLLLVGGAPNMCPSCKRTFVVQRFIYDPSGQIQAEVGVLQHAPPVPTVTQ